MDDTTLAELSIKWRDFESENEVRCFLAPTDEPDPTDEWLQILVANRQILEGDPHLYEELLNVVSGWMVRLLESAGIEGVEMLRFPGGVPPMSGAS